jgi:hypothetical protein
MNKLREQVIGTIYLTSGENQSDYVNKLADELITLIRADILEDKTCEWHRAFDGHFNISCVDETKERANGNFKPSDGYSSKWNFTYCPYCGGKIKAIDNLRGKSDEQ